jgi:hypothetical protein
MLTLDKSPRAPAVKRSAQASPDETPKPIPHAKKALALKRGAPTEQPRDRLVSMKDAGIMLNCHVATVRRLIESGALIAIRVASRKVGIRLSSIEAHMRANEIADFRA